MKVNWLDRRISPPGPHLCLCLSEAEFLSAMRHLRVLNIPKWMATEQANATAHHVRTPCGKLSVVVCLSGWRGRNPIEVAGLLVHEAVHAWQEWCDYIGEAAPAREQEAYTVQALSQELMAEFARRMNGA